MTDQTSPAPANGKTPRRAVITQEDVTRALLQLVDLVWDLQKETALLAKESRALAEEAKKAARSNANRHD